jgi:hypothetical protein
LLYNILSTYDWSCVYNTTSVDSAVACLNTAVLDAMEHVIPRDIITLIRNSHKGIIVPSGLVLRIRITSTG